MVLLEGVRMMVGWNRECTAKAGQTVIYCGSFFPGFGPPPGLNALRRDNQGGQPGPHFHPLVPGDSMGPEELVSALRV